MSIQEIQAIDVHGHYGTYRGAANKFTNEFMSADAAEVVRRAKIARTAYTVVSPLEALLPRFGSDPIKGNLNATRDVAKTEGLLQWVVIDPLKPDTFAQADEMLRHPQCVGIKIHPEEHGYPIVEHGPRIFEFASERKAVVITHSGEQLSLPSDIVDLANTFPDVQLILAHIGCGWDGDKTHQVRAISDSKHSNVYADTSSASSVTSKLIEYAVKEVGAERILFGTDTPLYYAPMMRARIDLADISDDQKRLILRDNASKLLNLPVH